MSCRAVAAAPDPAPDAIDAIDALAVVGQAYDYDTGNPEDDALTRGLINELVSVGGGAGAAVVTPCDGVA